jgi:hypothetical protein
MKPVLQIAIAAVLAILSYSWLVKPGLVLFGSYNSRSMEWESKKGRYKAIKAEVLSVKITRNEVYKAELAEPQLHYLDHELDYRFELSDGSGFSGTEFVSRIGRDEILPLKSESKEWDARLIYYDSIHPYDHLPEDLFRLYTEPESQSTQKNFRLFILISGSVVCFLSLVWMAITIRKLIKQI